MGSWMTAAAIAMALAAEPAGSAGERAPEAPAPAEAPAAGAAAEESPANEAPEAGVADSAALERAAKAAEQAAQAAERSAAAAERAADDAARLAKRSLAEAGPEREEEPKEPVWSGTATLGFISLTGNASTLTLNGETEIERRSPEWIVLLSARGTYGQSRVAQPGEDPQVLALAGELDAKGDRRFTDHFSAYLEGGVETDHVKSIEARPFGEVGLGIIWLQRLRGDFVKARVASEVALRYAQELRFQYFPSRTNLDDETIVAPKVGLRFRYGLNPDVVFVERLSLLQNIYGPSRTIFKSTTKMTTRLISAFGIAVAFEVNHDSAPAAGKVPTDTSLTVSFEAGF